ncbi:lysine-specific demethylase 6B-like [Cuculus canorus]|uniref:lysine-specific demethylase 6B-like n=1 Tax=Cuculus canorus TaxID=55661 RepID=UPI0023AACA29|nr:lysine-specific demethylase 6B-like [Cuculus canorus]
MGPYREGAPPRAPPGTLESLQGCVRALQPQPWEPPSPLAEAPPDLEEPPGCYHSPPTPRCHHRGHHRGDIGHRGGDIARIGRLQQAQLWGYPSAPPPPARARTLPPLQQVWSLLHPEFWGPPAAPSSAPGPPRPWSRPPRKCP